MLHLHRRYAVSVRASPRLWTAPLSTAAPSSKSRLPFDEALAVASAGLKLEERKKLKNDLSFELLEPTMRAFHAATGHWIVPYHFPVPKLAAEERSLDVKKSLVKTQVIGRVNDVSEIDWPREAYGLNLGRTLDKLMRNSKYKNEYPEVVQGLRDIGFPVDVDWHEYKWKHQTMAALRIFKSLRGHTIVPIEFVVPRGDASSTWPVCTWGFRLGKKVDALRSKYESLTQDALADLESIQFCKDAAEAEWSEMILPSLETFAKLNGHCNVAKAFVVPSAEPWPKMAWGFKLGRVVSSMRILGTFSEQAERDAERLEALSFVWASSDYRWKEIMMPAFEAFALFHGSCQGLSYDFVVPSEAPWPKVTWGRKLGVLVRNLRYRKHFAPQIARDETRLEELGVEWRLPSKSRKRQ